MATREELIKDGVVTVHLPAGPQLVRLADLLATTAPVPPPVPVPPAGKLTVAEINARLGRGVSLGTALEAPKEGDWGVILEPDDFKQIAAAGFKHVRLPARSSAYAGSGPSFGLQQGWLDRLNWCLDQAEANGLMIVFDPVHHFGEILSDASGNRPKFRAMWRQLAQLVARRAPSSVVAELINEPRDKASGAQLNGILADGLAEIRAVAPNHAVMIGAATNNSPWIPPEFDPPRDPLLILSVHIYTAGNNWGGDFTHQGVLGNPMTGSWQNREPGKAFIRQHLDMDAAWCKARGAALNVGEFGVSVPAPRADKLAWLEFVRTEAEARGASWTAWDDRSNTFGLRERGKPYAADVRKALGLSS